MINILVVNIKSQGGGAETVLRNLVNSIVIGKIGLKIDIFNKNEFDKDFFSSFKFIGYIKFLFELRSKSRRYDFVISGVEGIPFLICSIALLGLRKPILIMWLHCSPFAYLGFQNLKSRLAIRISLKISKNIFCAAPTEADEFVKIGKNALYLPNIRHNSQPAFPVIPFNVLPTFVFVGSLAPLKQPLKAIDILRRLSMDTRFAYRLDFYGTGPLMAELQSEIKNSQLDTYVKVHGFVSDPWQMIERGSILLLPSLTEAMPMVVLEALERGCVVISNIFNGYDFFDKHEGLFIGVDFSNIDLVISVINKTLEWGSIETFNRSTKSKNFLLNEFNNDNSIKIMHHYLDEMISPRARKD